MQCSPGTAQKVIKSKLYCCNMYPKYVVLGLRCNVKLYAYLHQHSSIWQAQQTDLFSVLLTYALRFYLSLKVFSELYQKQEN